MRVEFASIYNQRNLKLLNEDMRMEMGIKSREYCESKFDVNDVNSVLLSEMGLT